MAEAPSLSEIANIRVDPETSGIAAVPVIDNTKTVEQLNEQAKFHAQQVAQKYNTFLQNKKDLFANIGDIQGLESLPEDKPILQKQAGDILKEIQDNPSVITGGAGFNDVMTKMSKFKQTAMDSKQAFLDDKTHRVLLETTPEMDTPENRAKLENYKKLPIDKRVSPILDTPVIMDERSLFEKTLKDTTEPYTEYKVDDKGNHYIETGQEFNPNAFDRQWNLIAGQSDKNNKQLYGAIKYNFDHLPSDQKKQYQDAYGDDAMKQYWKYRGQLYLDAHIPPESNYEKTPQGNVRFGKTAKPDTEWITAQRAADMERHQLETERQGRERNEISLLRLGLAKDKLAKEQSEDISDANTVLNQAFGSIKNGTPVLVTNEKDGSKHTELSIGDPQLLKVFSTVDKSGKNTVPASEIRFNPENEQLTLVYGKQNASGGFGTGEKPTKEITMDKRTWLKEITKSSVPNKNIGGINQLIESVLVKNGGSLMKAYKKSEEPETDETKTTNAPKLDNKSTFSVKGKSYTKADLNKLGYTDEQIQEAIKLGNISTK